MVNQQTILIKQLQATRQKTLAICSYLKNEDFVVQPSQESSPPKWHLGHTTWFFEEVILKQFIPNYHYFNEHYRVLFNSYYKAVGIHTPQSERGHLSRPTVAEVIQYRMHVDHELDIFLKQEMSAEVLTLLETGIHHEQQHQELLYMDIKTILASNIIPTQYFDTALPKAIAPKEKWVNFKEGLYTIGNLDETFAYDNERPAHQHYCYPFAVSKSLVTNGDFLAFMQENGYAKAQYWLSQGWDWINQQAIKHPLYWVKRDDNWYEYTLHGLIPLDLNRPLVHISYYEADAFANWKNLRLPTEQELEIFLKTSKITALDNKTQLLHPNHADAANLQVWCWARSQYLPYPRYKAYDGLLNEYNSKFMCNQFVLKGGCIVTPQHHYRHSYRNFYLPHQRWMFSGIRLAKDII
jgi:ergothioneine biosynthesis protein EgtB